MRINNLHLSNFRNIKNLDMTPCDTVNIIYGDNAQGKTNIIESIWLFTGAKSFRGAKDNEFIAFSENTADISMDFFAHGRDQSSRIIFGEKKKILLNDIERTSIKDLVGEFYCCIFSPSHLSLIKDGPEKRRRFLDLAVGQIVPRYPAMLSSYAKILRQRNSLLNDLKYNSSLIPLLDTWDEHLINYGAYIINARQRYINLLIKHCENIYSGISDGNEKMGIEYNCSVKSIPEDADLQQIKKIFASEILNARREDIMSATTSLGPHRDDMDIFIDNYLAKTFGSQGQQRSCVLALKLAECDIIKDTTANEPIILLDDVMSELDNKRKDFIMNKIMGKQVFITCCDKIYFNNIENGRSFLVKNGEIKKIEDFSL